jgi:hypothetical protein
MVASNVEHDPWEEWRSAPNNDSGAIQKNGDCVCWICENCVFRQNDKVYSPEKKDRRYYHRVARLRKAHIAFGSRINSGKSSVRCRVTRLRTRTRWPGLVPRWWRLGRQWRPEDSRMTRKQQAYKTLAVKGLWHFSCVERISRFNKPRWTSLRSPDCSCFVNRLNMK